MTRMTPQLAEALAALDQDAKDGTIYRTQTYRAVLAAYRDAPVVEGRWRCREGLLHSGWTVEWMNFKDPFRQFNCPDQRTAEAYRDALNAADAALEEK